MTKKYFIVKHGLDSLEALPNFIWNTLAPKRHPPRGFRQIEKGDRWIGFAYTTSNAGERRLSLITGFYECTQTARFGNIPAKALPISGGKTKAWLIKGKAHDEQFRHPVGITSINDFLKKQPFNQATFVKISAKEFEAIRRYTLSHQFDPRKIPLFGREPRSEQEVLALIASCHRNFGIEKIIRVQTAFPDMLAKIKGKAKDVYLELELYSTSFLSHGHARQVRKRRFKDDEKPLAVLCWIDDDKNKKLKRYVHRVYELRNLIRTSSKIRWRGKWR